MGLISWFKVLAVLIAVQFTLSAENPSELSKQYLENIINHVNSAGAHWEVICNELFVVSNCCNRSIIEGIGTN